MIPLLKGWRMDWITLSVEIIGIAILCVWVVIPIREFAVIARRILPRKKQQVGSPERSSATPTPPLVEILP
jgi:hypothetical protein